MRARLPSCRSYLLNETERPDNRLEKSVRGAKRRSTEKNLRAGQQREKESRKDAGWEGGDDKSNAAFNYGPISAPSSRCAPLERILLKRCASPGCCVYCQVCASDYRFAYLFLLVFLPGVSALRVAEPAGPVVKKLSRASASGKNTRTSRLRLLIAEARDLPTREPCSPRRTICAWRTERSSVMDRGVRAIFSCTSATALDVYQSEFMPLPY